MTEREDARSSRPGRPGPPQADPPEEPVVPQRSDDDADTGWGERPADPEDERLTRERPPHWE